MRRSRTATAPRYPERALRNRARSQVALEVRRAGCDRERGDQPEVDDPREGAPPARDPVVALGTRRAAIPPPAPRLKRAEDDDQDQDRAGVEEEQRRHPDQAGDSECGMDRRDHAAAVELPDRRQVEQVEEEADEREREPEVAVGRRVGAEARSGADRAEDRPGGSDLELAP